MDEEYLSKSETGQSTGKILSQPMNGHFWCNNAIKGVTDIVENGQLYEKGSDSDRIDAPTLH